MIFKGRGKSILNYKKSFVKSTKRIFFFAKRLQRKKKSLPRFNNFLSAKYRSKIFAVTPSIQDLYTIIIFLFHGEISIKNVPHIRNTFVIFHKIIIALCSYNSHISIYFKCIFIHARCDFKVLIWSIAYSNNDYCVV